MPQKLGKGGAGPQNYVPPGNPAGGQYGDNESGSNKHYFNNFKKPVGVKIEQNGDTNKVDARSFYKGKGKKYLEEALTRKLGNKRGKLNENGINLLNSIKNADDELSGIISDYLEQNKNVSIKLGKNLSDSFKPSTSEIKLGNSSFGEDITNYSKGGVFFHEAGHGLDYTYGGYFTNNYYRREKETYSHGFKSEKYGKTMTEMIREEIKQNVNFGELLNDFNKKQKEYITDEYLTMDKKREELLKERAKIYSDFNENILKVDNEYIKINKELDALKAERINVYDTIKSFNERALKLNELNRKILDKDDERAARINVLLPKKYTELGTQIRELTDKTINLRNKAYSDANIMYGDISDMCQASIGRKLQMGHKGSYWDNDGINRGTEAFAEIMSAKATNPESLKILQKYIPKTLEIFDEIMTSIRSK